MRRRPLQPNPFAILAAAVLASLALALPADAQIFIGAGHDAVAMPAVPAVAEEPAPSRDLLRFLPNTLDGLELSGENGDIRWPIYLTAAQAAAPLRFRVGYLSAVSVLPDASKLEIKVNETSIGIDVIDASRGLRTVEFAVPADLMRSGYNAISVTVRQRHRVDCSVQATYELWTRIDPTETGLVLPGAVRTITDATDLAALLPRADGTLPIHIVLAGKTNPAHLRHLMTATQQIALSAHALQPSVDFTPASVDPYGVDLVVGTREMLRRLPQLVETLGNTGPLEKVLPAVGNGRPTLIVTGSDAAELDQAIAQLAASVQPSGTSAGLLALTNYPALAINGATRLHLRDLGIHSQNVSGRLFRKSFGLTLPADFLASDYGRGTFDLVGGYASGLTRDAQVRVDVNGRNSGVVRLPFVGGDVFKHNQLFLPLSLMRPGLNRIDIVAETPRPEDTSCAANDSKRFLVLDSSEIALPPLAHVQRLPDLALAASGGLPFLRGGAHLVVPKPDRETMGAALSLTARAAVAAGTIIPFDFATTMPSDDSGSTIVVSPARALDPAVMDDIGLDSKAVEAAWRYHAASPEPAAAPESGANQRWWLTRTDGPAACRLPSHAGAMPNVDAVVAPSTSRMAPPIATDGDDLLETWGGAVRKGSGWRDTFAAIPVMFADWTRSATATIRWPVSNRENSHGIDPNASLILAQGMSRGSSNNVTTIVTAVDAPTLRASVACLFDPQVWSKVHGRLTVLDASNGAVTTTDATTFHYISSGAPSLANSRLVIAGWFSLNPFAFVAFALLTAFCLGGTTLWFVRGVGRRPE